MPQSNIIKLITQLETRKNIAWIWGVDNAYVVLETATIFSGGNRSNNVAYINNRYHTRVGKDAPYQNLITEKAQINEYMSKNPLSSEELCPIDSDHVNCKTIRELVGLDINQSWAMNSTSILNQSREYEKQEQNLLFKINQYRDILLPNLVGDPYQQSFDGMINNATRRHLKHIEFLEKYSMFNPLMANYKKNSRFGVMKICNFADNYQLPYNEKGIITTFYINHVLNKSLEIAKVLKANINYLIQGQKFFIDYVIKIKS